jgi:chorismate mutase / prephenate dehydratase
LISQQDAPESFKVSPETIVSLYRDYLIPLTIEIEIEYLLHRLDKPLVAFLGPDGTFSHQASVDFFSDGVQMPVGTPTELVAAKCDVAFQPVANISDVFEAVLSNRVTNGVVPLENSIAGRVQQTMEQLYDTHAQIVGEQYLRIQHNLVAKKGTNRIDIKKIYSHKQPLMQCENWLRKNFPNAELVEVSSTAKAAELVSQQETAVDIAAICSSLAAERLGLEILSSGIEDSPNNVTRFLVLGKQLPSPSGHDHTIMTFGTSHQGTRNLPRYEILCFRNFSLTFFSCSVGALSSALSILSKYECNMFALESFPNKQEPWKYNFFVELSGHVEEENFKKALIELKEVTSFIRVLGCFRDKHPNTDPSSSK